MKAIAQRRETATLESLLDRVLCHDVRDGAGKVAVAKGARLTSKAAETLLATPWEEIHLLALEPGDLHEEEGGRRLGAAAVGEGVEVKGYGGGQWTLTANRRGLLKIRRGPLADANALEGISIFTLFDGQPVEPGETVAKCKVTPLVIAETTIRAIEKTARDAGGLVMVRAFRPATIGAVAQERLEPNQRARFEAALQQKVEWFGSRLLPVRFAGGSPRVVADELAEIGSSPKPRSAPSRRRRVTRAGSSWCVPSAQRRSAPSPRSASSPISAPASRRRSSRRSSGSGAGSYQCASRAARRASSPTNWPRCAAPGPRSSSSPARARSIRSTPCSADSRCSALAWSATALRRIPAASCGSPSGTASLSSACPRVGCSLRRRRSTSCFRRSWRVSPWTTGRSPSSATAACSRATWPTASRPIGRTLRVGSSNERHAGGAGTLQRCHPGPLASAALPRRAAGRGCG